MEIEEEALKRAKDRQPKLLKAAEDARNKATQASAAASDARENVDFAEKEKPELEKKIRELSSKIDESYGTREGQGVEYLRALKAQGIPIIGSGDTLLDEYEKSVTRLNTITGILPRLRKDAASKTTAERLASDAASRAEAYAEANANRIDEKQDQVDTHRKVNEVLNAGAIQATQGKIGEDYTKELEKLGDLHVGPFSGLDLQNVAMIERLKAMGKPITDAQAKQVQAFEEFANKIGANTWQLTNQMFRMAGSQNTLADKVKANEDLIKQLESRIKSLTNR